MHRAPDATGALTIEHGDETLELLPQRVLWWPRTRTLVVADLHFGKAATFRNAGIPVPAGQTRTMLHRLDALIDDLGARRLCFLGDLVHSRAGCTDALVGTLRNWRADHAQVEMLLVPGNHDRHAKFLPMEVGIGVTDARFVVERLEFVHDPKGEDDASLPRIAGHVHPCVRIRDRLRQNLRFACFHASGGTLTLPAFGEFTGGHAVKPTAGDRIYLVAGEQVVALPVNLPLGRPR